MVGGEHWKLRVVLWPGLFREGLGAVYFIDEVLAYSRFANCGRNVFHRGVLAVWLLGSSLAAKKSTPRA